MLPSQAFSSVNTDKIWRHGYGAFYDFVLTSLLGQGVSPIRILEIGISDFGEGSGHAWSRMPNVDFVGIDTEPLTTPLSSNSWFIEGNAYTREMVERLKRQCAPFHLVIDDGTHKLEDQIFFFKNYLELCASSSIMICEDVHRNIFEGSHFERLRDMNLSFIRPDFFGGIVDSNLLVYFNGESL